jgi:gliding motility-associated-like protein
MGVNVAKAQCPTITFPSTICAGESCGAGTPFTVSGDTVGITKYKWEFGDTGTQADTSNLKFPSYRYPDVTTSTQFQGTLTITRLVNGVPQETTCPFTVQVNPGIPDFDITPNDNLGPQDEEICKGSTATLTPVFRNNQQPPANATYLWSTGDESQTLEVGDSVKCYSLTITDPATGCTKSQKINITVYKPDPNAPTPPREEGRWYFGSGAGIKFEGGTPVAVTEGQLNTPEGTSAVSGSDGKILFYTDGRNVYTKNNTPMKDRNGVDVTTDPLINNSLNGSPEATQGVLIIAQPGCNDCDPVYYIFTTTSLGAGSGTQLSYSVVDMRLNDGLGQVTLKNAPLFNNSTERVVGVTGQANPNDPNAQATNWIITHDFNSNTFRVYPLTPQGVGQPTLYNVGRDHGPNKEQGEGYMKVYDDKLVVVIPGTPGVSNNYVQVFDFDNTTGEVSNPLQLDLGPAPPAAYGVELVSDKLYVSLNGGGTVPSQLVQFNLADTIPDTSVQATKEVIANAPGVEFGALQVDPNGQRVYLAKRNSPALGVINNPAGDSATAQFELDGFNLGGKNSQLGLPNTQPPNNQGYGQGLSFDSPVCVPPNTPTTVTLRAQPDRAGGDPAKSSYAWTIKRQDGTVLATYPDAGLGVNDSLAYTFPGPGRYSITLAIDNDCLAQPEEFTEPLYIGVAPPPVTLRDTSVCATATVRLEAYPNQAGPQGATYTWRLANGGTRTGKAINVTIADVTATNSTFTLVVAADSCTQTASARVNFQRIPVELGNDTTVCQATTLLLNAGVAGLRYQWTRNGTAIPGATQQVHRVTPESTAVQYGVTVTDPLTGCFTTDAIKVQAGVKPTVGFDATLPNACNAQNGTIALFSSDSDAATFRYEWFLNGELLSFVVGDKIDNAEVGIYQVKVTNLSGCETTVTIPINVADDVAAPRIEPIDPLTLPCDGEVTIAPQITPSNDPNFLYEWRSSDNRVAGNEDRLTLPQPNFGPGVYTLTVTDLTTNCKAVAVAEVNPNPNQTEVVIENVPNGCGRVFLQAVLTGGNTNPANFTYKWIIEGTTQTLSTNDTLTVSGTNQAVNYVVEVTSTDGCVARDTATVTFPPDAPLNLGGPYPAACAPNAVSLNPPADPNWDTYVWTWTPAEGTPRSFAGRQFNATQTAAYTLTARNSRTGCQKQATVNVTVNPTPPAPTFQTPPNAVICVGAVSRPSFTPNNIVPGATVRWYNNPGLTGTPAVGSPFTPQVTDPDTYVYYVTQTLGSCQSPATPVTLVINATPVIELGPDRNVCQGETAVLNALPRNPGGGPVTYRWENGLTTQTINATRSGTYRVTVTQGGCPVTDEVTLTFVAPPETSIPRRTVALCLNDAAATATLDGGPGANFTYEWRKLGSPAVLGTTRTIIINSQGSNIGRYIVSIGNGGSCTRNDTIEVVAKCEPTVFVPDAFAPDGRLSDNQRLFVFGKYVGEIQMLIYNRWGELIHAHKGNNLDELRTTAWDGNYLGKPVPTGTYVWKITYRSTDFPEREPITLRGAVLLMR